MAIEVVDSQLNIEYVLPAAEQSYRNGFPYDIDNSFDSLLFVTATYTPNRDMKERNAVPSMVPCSIGV